MSRTGKCRRFRHGGKRLRLIQSTRSQSMFFPSKPKPNHTDRFSAKNAVRAEESTVRNIDDRIKYRPKYRTYFVRNFDRIFVRNMKQNLAEYVSTEFLSDTSSKKLARQTNRLRNIGVLFLFRVMGIHDPPTVASTSGAHTHVTGT